MKLLGKNREEARRAVTEGHATIAVYGLGKMGLPLAAAFADAGARVIGVDVNAELVDKINSGECPLAGEPGLAEAITRGTTSGRLSATTDGVAAASEADLCAILVPTSLTQKNGVCAPDQGAVASVARAIAEGLGAGGIVVTECTMPPGSTEALVPLFSKHGRVLNEDYGLAHCPERTMSGTALRDIRGEYPKIIGASSPAALEAVAGVYEAVNSKGVIACSSIKTAELVKIFEGV
ncbi:MAG: NAD(P)-binding domain-containing protein, partial [Candidatus Micrarchaeia archaeon]